MKEKKVKEKKIKDKKEKKKLSTAKKVLLIILAVILLMLITAASVFTYAWYNKPKDNSNAFGDLPTLPPDVDVVVPGDNTGDNKPPVNPPSNDEENSQVKKGIYNFLLLCHDRVALNTDVMMVINLNTMSNKISVLQIPRDTYIQLDYFHGKLNALYAHYYVSGANDGEKNPTSYGLRKMCETIQYNMYLPLQGAAIINLDGFRNIVDILGGVEVNIPADMI
ncbi:MAG: LCP family protein, partial [Clostridia bacterium]|nr:LCP family protein [Clostridia bacterium]